MYEMRKISLFAGVVALALGVTAMSGSAFAACLNSERQLPAVSLTQDTGNDLQGLSNDDDAYQAILNEGNSCLVQQSQPVAQDNRAPRTAPRTVPSSVPTYN
jgi:hypothetical protein